MAFVNKKGREQYIYKGYNAYNSTMVRTNKLTTIAIYRSDMEALTKMLGKSELYRDKFHELVMKEKKGNG